MTLGLQFGTNCEHNRQKSSIGDDMAGSVNKVILVGNVGKDPEVRTFGNGGKVANFSIATSESWKDKQTGERKEKTDWHNIAIFNDGLVGIVERYVKKGTKHCLIAAIHRAAVATAKAVAAMAKIIWGRAAAVHMAAAVMSRKDVPSPLQCKKAPQRALIWMTKSRFKALKKTI